MEKSALPQRPALEFYTLYFGPFIHIKGNILINYGILEYPISRETQMWLKVIENYIILYI